MIKALWFLLKVTALIALVVWLADRPGSMRLDWVDLEGNDIVVNVQIGLFLAGLFGFVLLSIFIYQTIKTFVDLPKSMARYNEVKAREKGYRALTIGLSAVAAGDTRTAVKEAARARKFLPQDTGLPLLLDAQAARLDGRESDAAKSFVALLEDKDASFLGVRGLLQAALDARDFDTALTLASKALKSYPKQVWILKIAYDLQLRAKLWEEARGTLKGLEKTGGVSKDKARSDRAAMLVAEGDDALARTYTIYAEETYKAATKAAPEFAPAVTRLAQMYIAGDERKKAVKLIEKSWKLHPHETYLPIWDALIEERKAEEPLERLKWFERLAKINASAPFGLIAAGQAAMDAGLWGEAREYLMRAQGEQPSAALYSALAELEERSTHDEAAIKTWLSRAINGAPQKVWVCRETGRMFNEWMASVPPDGRFNTLEWGDPLAYGAQQMILIEDSGDNVRSVLEAPKTDAA